MKIRFVKLYSSATRRNEWVDWNGNTSIVVRSGFRPRINLLDLKSRLNKFRTQGESYLINEHLGILVEGNKKLLLSCKDWEKELCLKNFPKIASIQNIQQWFSAECESNNLTYFCETTNESNFDVYDTLSSFYEYKSIPTRGTLSWSSHKREMNKDHCFNVIYCYSEKLTKA